MIWGKILIVSRTEGFHFFFINSKLFVCFLGDLREELDSLAKTCSDQQKLIHQAINKAPGKPINYGSYFLVRISEQWYQKNQFFPINKRKVVNWQDLQLQFIKKTDLQTLLMMVVLMILLYENALCKFPKMLDILKSLENYFFYQIFMFSSRFSVSRKIHTILKFELLCFLAQSYKKRSKFCFENKIIH